MGQRLASAIHHPFLLDPSTGKPLEALGILPLSGRVVWPVIGGSGETETEDETETDTGTDDQETETETETEEIETEQTGTVTREDFIRLENRMKAADRRASNAENKLKEKETAELSDSERLQKERDEAKAESEKTSAALKHTRIENAFLALDGTNWVNKEDALTMLISRYGDSVEIDENGKVTGVAEAAKRMAKEKSYLVKIEAAGTASGDVMNGKRKGDRGDNTAKTAELQKRFPHLARKG